MLAYRPWQLNTPIKTEYSKWMCRAPIEYYRAVNIVIVTVVPIIIDAYCCVYAIHGNEQNTDATDLMPLDVNVGIKLEIK